MKTYTISEVLELQNQRKQLEQRLAVHRQRAIEKQQELQKIFANEGVKSIEELYNLCIATNNEMQKYAIEESENIANMRNHCDELDRLL